MPAKGEKKKGERGLGPNRGTSSRSPYPNVANTPVRGTSERISKRMTQISASDLIAQQNHLDPYSLLPGAEHAQSDRCSPQVALPA